MDKLDWRPSCAIKVLQDRAKLLQQVREFFAVRKVIEVDTPLIGSYSATALHIDPIAVIDDPGDRLISNKSRFLQTSPEYAMKRLLAAGSNDIFQICKAFRAKEAGRLHNPEFTMLEWYRCNFDHHQLMQEVTELLLYVLTDVDISYQINKLSYREIFYKGVNVDPISTSLSDLRKLVKSKINLSKGLQADMANASKQDCQELLFTHIVEPMISQQNQVWCIYDYPEEQAALSRIVLDQFGDPVGQRFEVYVNGIELANGYHELTDAEIQYQRFVADQAQRKILNKQVLEIDPYLIAALEFGLPACSGVALGLDRLLMLKNKADEISEVICFPYDRA